MHAWEISYTICIFRGLYYSRIFRLTMAFIAFDSVKCGKVQKFEKYLIIVLAVFRTAINVYISEGVGVRKLGLRC